MRGQGRNDTGPERSGAPPALERFSAALLPERDRVPMLQELFARTMTGAEINAIGAADVAVDVSVIKNRPMTLAHAYNRDFQNDRTRHCLRDGDDDLAFLVNLGGEGRYAHGEQREIWTSGEATLFDFAKTFDLRWSEARVLVARLPRAGWRGLDLGQAVGRKLPAGTPVLSLFRSYARAVWREASRSGRIEPIAERQLGELIAAACASDPETMGRATRPAIAAARVAAMRETIRRDFANPCLSMRQVAAAVGLSERAGHLAFEAAGLVFTEELHAVRLDHARERLVSTMDRVIDTAFAVGFSDASHFHRLFKRRYGCTPGEIRGLAATRGAPARPAN